MESVAGIKWNGWPDWNGIHGRDRPEYAVDDQLLNEALDSTAIIRTLSTPRDVIRLTNRLKITAKNTWGEVNFVDMLAFATLEVKYPTISNAIRNNPELFLKTSVLEGDYILQDQLDDISDDSKSGEEPQFIKGLLANYNSLETKNVRSILSFMFPTLLRKWEDISQEEAVTNNRICTREPLLKLLHSGPNKYMFSSKEVKHFLESDTDRREILLDYLQSGSIASWLQYANQFIKRANIRNPSSLCKELLEISSIAFKDYQLNLTDYTSLLLISLICQSNDRKQILNVISTTEISLSVSEHVILRLLSKYDMWSSGTYKGHRVYTADELDSFPLPPDNLIREKNVWLETVRKVTSKTNIIENEPEPISIFFRWGQLNDNNYSEVQSYLEKETDNKKFLSSFVECFHGGKGIQGIEKLISHIPTFLSRTESLVNPPSYVDGIITYLQAIDRE